MSALPVGPRLAFSAATERDVAAVVALVESAYRGEESRRGWTTEADLLGGQRTDAAAVASLVGGSGLLLLARFEGELVGCCNLTPHTAGVVRLGMLAVAPSLQGAGIGRALLEEGQRRAQETLGAEVVELTVVSLRSELLAWYARRGFVPTGRSEPFPYGNDRYGLPKRGDLTFVVLERRLTTLEG